MDAQRPAAAQSPERRAALTLYAMSREDRAWMFERLDAVQKSVVTPLLEELEALGMPRDASLLDMALEQPVGATPAPSPMAIDESNRLLDRLGATDLDHLAQVLAAEPPMLTARLLAAQAWNEATPLREKLGAARAARVDDAMPRAVAAAREGGAALERALLGAVASVVRSPGSPRKTSPAAAHGTMPTHWSAPLARWWRASRFARARGAMRAQHD